VTNGAAEPTRSISSAVGPGLEAPRQARALVRRHLKHWQAEQVLDDALLLVSEVVTNAVRHGSSDVVLTLSETGDEVRVEVFDSSPLEPVLVPFTDEHQWGRGIALVNALSCRWGVEPAPPRGKRVWFVIGPDCPAHSSSN